MEMLKPNTNVSDYFQTKPSSQSHKQLEPTLQQILDCNCPSHSRENAENFCDKCESKYPTCCTKIFKMCLRCRSRYHDPVNTVEKPLTEIFFEIKDTGKMAQTFTFSFRRDNPVIDGYGVEVRCFKPWKEMIQFPMLGTLYINDKLMTTLKPLIKCSNISYRRDNSFFIDRQYLKNSNLLRLQIAQCLPSYFERFQSDPKDQSYFLGIYIVKNQTYLQLLQNLSLHSTIGIEESIKKFFKSSDSQFESSEITVKLQCPYSSQLIKVPARGGHCKHFHTFCLSTLYKLYSEKRKWDCPICSLHLHQIVIDKWILNAINQKQRNSDQFTVKFTVDGKWEWKEEKKVVQSEGNQDEQEEESTKKPILTARKTVKLPQSHKQQTHLQKQKQKQSEKVKQIPKNIPIIIIEEEQPAPNRKQQRQQRLQKSLRPKPQPQPIQKELSYPQYEQMAIPIIDFQLYTKDKASKILKELSSEFDKLTLEPKRKVKHHSDQFKNLFKLH